MMRKHLVFASFSLLAIYPAYAAPSFCTGTTTVITSGTFVAGSTLVNIGLGTSTGNCIEASDKIFGGFTVSGAITGGGSAGWLFTMPTGPANVSLGFQGLVGPGLTGTVDYDVAVDPALSNGALIENLEKDFTLNAITAALGSATLTGSGGGVNFSCSRTVNPTGPATGACPETLAFTPTTQIAVVETIASAANTNVTGLTDTVSQAVVPEPPSLAMLGGALGIFGLIGLRRRHG